MDAGSDTAIDGSTRKIPTHETTYGALRDMILFGHLAPGQPVTIQGLINDLAAGMTPVREAIRRLTAEGALLPQGNRRVSVPQLSLATLDQIAFARLSIEPELVRLAADRLTPALIDELTRLDNRLTDAIGSGDIHAYLECNHAFHFLIYDASDAPVLVDIARSLWLRFGPSLRAVCARVGASALPDLHVEALAAMRNHDTPALTAAITRDIAQGIEQVRLALAQGEV